MSRAAWKQVGPHSWRLDTGRGVVEVFQTSDRPEKGLAHRDWWYLDSRVEYRDYKIRGGGHELSLEAAKLQGEETLKEHLLRVRELVREERRRAREVGRPGGAGASRAEWEQVGPHSWRLDTGRGRVEVLKVSDRQYVNAYARLGHLAFVIAGDEPEPTLEAAKLRGEKSLEDRWLEAQELAREGQRARHPSRSDEPRVSAEQPCPPEGGFFTPVSLCSMPGHVVIYVDWQGMGRRATVTAVSPWSSEVELYVSGETVRCPHGGPAPASGPAWLWAEEWVAWCRRPPADHAS